MGEAAPCLFCCMKTEAWMRKGQIFEGIIERVDFPNKGIVYLQEEERYVTVKTEFPDRKSAF